MQSGHVILLALELQFTQIYMTIERIYFEALAVRSIAVSVDLYIYGSHFQWYTHGHLVDAAQLEGGPVLHTFAAKEELKSKSLRILRNWPKAAERVGGTIWRR